MCFVKCFRNVLGFKPEKVPDDIDTVIIGSGISGLTTAVLLGRVGQKVLVLEQHDQAGGCCHAFQDKGYEFSTGSKCMSCVKNVSIIYEDTLHFKKQISQLICSFLFKFVFFENISDDLIAFFNLLYKIENIFRDILHVYDRLMHDNLPSCLQVTE